MNHRSRESNQKVIVIGGGPAGMSAALWCADLGLQPVLIERQSELGGQLLSIHNPISNYIGLQAENGMRLRDHFRQSIKDISAVEQINAQVFGIEPSTMSAILSDNSAVTASAMIVATGVRRKKLGVPGEEQFRGKGILRSGAGEKTSVKGGTVVIIGGGDAAMENALILSEFADRVVVVHRRSEFTARREFVDAARTVPRVGFQTGSTVVSIEGEHRVNSVVVRNGITGATSRINADAVLIRIGVEPNTEFLKGKVSLDSEGYILTDTEMATSSEGIFAAGDAAMPAAPTIASAAGSGAAAAKSVLTWIRRNA